jgi:hypothetical protein
MLLSAPSAEARAQVRRAAPFLANLQRASGAFDDTESEVNALIALRALDTARTMG